LALGLNAGDEVIVPNYTMIATPNSVKMFGAVPVFVDVEEKTLCLDYDLVKKAITPKTKAIIYVSANGRYPETDISSLVKLASDYDLMLIEDAAQSLGSFYPDGRHVGRAGIVGSFSFSAPKIISTGQGGALITDDDKVAWELRRLKDFGRSGGGNDIHDRIGYNFKFTELQACVGIEQMKKLQERVVRKKEIWKLYSTLLEPTSGIQLFQHNLDYTAPWFIDSLVENRDSLIHWLNSCGVGTRLMYPPINEQLAYNVSGEWPVSKLIGAKGLWLPSAVQLKDDDVEYICSSINEFYN
jgi:perosamine synthetase